MGDNAQPGEWTIIPVLAGISAICLLTSAALCIWAIRHLCSAGPNVRKKLFWGQLLALSSTDLFSSLMHAAVYPGCPWLLSMFPEQDTKKKNIEAFFGSSLFGHTLSFFDFASCLLEVQIAAGFAAASSGSPRFASILRWTLPLSFVAALGLDVAVQMMHDTSWKGPVSPFWTLSCDRGNIFWSSVVLVCCLFIAVLCGYSIVKISASPGTLRHRGHIRGVSYAMNAIVTWVPIATVGTYPVFNEQTNDVAFWFWAKALANFLFFLNGAANVSCYVFWMWRSRRLQERMDARWSVSACESFVLDTYFDLEGIHDAETLEAMRLAAEAIATVRVAEEGLKNIATRRNETRPNKDCELDTLDCESFACAENELIDNESIRLDTRTDLRVALATVR